jgi:hypothetical protein
VVSPVAGKRYGVERVCKIFEQARSIFYGRQCSDKRGPKAAVSDSELAELIRADLAASPFQRGKAIARCGLGCGCSAKSGCRRNGYCG